MDILISSNLERLIYLVSGENSAETKALMEALTADGSYTITDEMKERLTEFAGGYATEAETSECIRNVYEETGYVIDTHTAVACLLYTSRCV